MTYRQLEELKLATLQEYRKVGIQWDLNVAETPDEFQWSKTIITEKPGKEIIGYVYIAAGNYWKTIHAIDSEMEVRQILRYAGA